MSSIKYLMVALFLVLTIGSGFSQDRFRKIAAISSGIPKGRLCVSQITAEDNGFDRDRHFFIKGVKDVFYLSLLNQNNIGKDIIEDFSICGANHHIRIRYVSKEKSEQYGIHDSLMLIFYKYIYNAVTHGCVVGRVGIAVVPCDGADAYSINIDDNYNIWARLVSFTSRR